MAIIEQTGDFLRATSPALVVPANSFGTAEGAVGRALLAAHPAAATAYRSSAEGRRLAIGTLVSARGVRGALLIFLPIRSAPSDRITIDAIEQGLLALRTLIIAQRLERVALSLSALAPTGPLRVALRARISALLGALSATIELYP